MKVKIASSFWTWFILTAVLLVVFYAPELFCNRDFFQSDHTFYFEPFARVIGAAYKQWHLPLWNPYCYSGMPQIANPSPGIFYLPDLLFAIMPYSQAMAAILVIQQLVAFTAAFLLVESLGWGVAAAAFCGLIMALNGYMMSLSANYTLPGSAAWGILGLYGMLNIGRLEKHGRPCGTAHRAAFTILTAVGVQGTIMAGRPEVFVPMMALIASLAGFMWLGWLRPFDDQDKTRWKGWGDRSRIFAWQLAAIILGILLCAYILLPVYEWSKLSPRAAGIKLEHVFTWSTNWYDLLGMLCPQPLGDLQQPSPWLKLVASRPTHYPFLPSALIGPVALSLMLLGLGDKTFKERWCLLGGFTAALVLAIGKYGPVSTFVLKYIPFLSVLRYPCKLLIVVILFVAVIGARGLYLVAQEKVRPWQKKSLTALWLVLTVMAAIFDFGSVYCSGTITTLPAKLVQELGQSLLVTSLIGLFVSFAIYFAGEPPAVNEQKAKNSFLNVRFASASVALLLVLLAVASIFVPMMKYQPRTVAGGYYDRVPVIYQRLHTLDKTFGNPMSGRYLCLYWDPLKVADGYNPRYPGAIGEPFMQYARELCLPNTNCDSQLREAFGYESSENQDYRVAFLDTIHKSSVDKEVATDVELSRFCNLAGVRYLGAQIIAIKGPTRILNSAYFNLVHEDLSMNYRVYEARSSKPRAFFADTYQTVKDQSAVKKAIMAGETPDKDGYVSPFDRQAFIELDTNTDVTKDPLNFTDYSATKASALLNGPAGGAIQVSAPVFSPTPVVGIGPEDKASATGKTAVNFLRDDPEHISISASVPASGFLILNDRYYPGWHALLDTVPVPMYRANGFMRGVYLTKGSHLVEFKYEPESLRNGFYIAGVASLVMLVLALIWLKQPASDTVHYLSTGKWPVRDESPSQEQSTSVN